MQMATLGKGLINGIKNLELHVLRVSRTAVGDAAQFKANNANYD